MKNSKYAASFLSEAEKLALSSNASYAEISRDLGGKLAKLISLNDSSPENKDKTATLSKKISPRVLANKQLDSHIRRIYGEHNGRVGFVMCFVI